MAILPSNKIVRGADISVIGSAIKSQLNGKQDLIESTSVVIRDTGGTTPSGSITISGGILTLYLNNLVGGDVLIIGETIETIVE